MALFGRGDDGSGLPRGDRGAGDFGNYDYNLRARRKGTKIVLANSDPSRDELRTLFENGDIEAETAISARTIEQERVDAPIEVRLFTGRRVSGVVGRVPWGLESIVDETLRRLGDSAQKARIPVRIVQKRNGSYRVELLMGRVR